MENTMISIPYGAVTVDIQHYNALYEAKGRCEKMSEQLRLIKNALEIEMGMTVRYGHEVIGFTEEIATILNVPVPTPIKEDGHQE